MAGFGSYLAFKSLREGRRAPDGGNFPIFNFVATILLRYSATFLTLINFWLQRMTSMDKNAQRMDSVSS